jgi:hypothetical protein
MNSPFTAWDQEVPNYTPPKGGQSNDIVPLPPGYYNLIVLSVEMIHIESTGAQKLLWKFEVAPGEPMAGRKHEKWCQLETAQNRNFAFNDFLQAGLNVTSWTQALAALPQLKRRVLACKHTPPNAKGFTSTYINGYLGDADIPF